MNDRTAKRQGHNLAVGGIGLGADDENREAQRVRYVGDESKPVRREDVYTYVPQNPARSASPVFGQRRGAILRLLSARVSDRLAATTRRGFNNVSRAS